jgi:hypothetical protein
MQQDLVKITSNLEQVQPEWKLQKSGNESQFQLAIMQPKIRQSSLDDLKAVLRYAMVKVGLRAQNFPTDDEKAVLLSHVISEYGNHTPDEIRLAFDMSITGRLDLERSEVVCYENFSCLYFSGIMNAYRIWARNQKIETVTKEEIKILEYKEPTDDTEMEAWYNGVKREYLDGKYHFNLLPITLYDYICRKSEIVNKKEYWQKAMAQRLAMLKNELQSATREFERAQIKESIKYIESGNKSKAHSEYSHLTSISKRLVIVNEFNGK